MSFLRKTLANVGGRLRALLGRGAQPTSAAGPGARFRELTNFGSNPGNARMFAYLPHKPPRRPALVVALHGCAQSAAIYDYGAGWSTLADELGFIVVCPEQQRTNNPQGCFSWFAPGDIERDQGEVLSIRQMVDHAIRTFGVDPRRVFVTGLSAGGAMASAMLATYPDVFSAGAIIAGLPYGCATTVEEAFAAMFGTRRSTGTALGDRVRAASRHRGPWPRISVWHGSADAIVRPVNAEDLVRQWTQVHDLPEQPTHEERLGPHTRRVWDNSDGETIIESYTIAGMGHGVPIAVGAGPESCGAVAPFFMPVGISSTRRIATFWGLSASKEARRPTPAGETLQPTAIPELAFAEITTRAASDRDPEQQSSSRTPSGAFEPNDVIAAAFKAAGLPVPEINALAAQANPLVAPGPIITAAMKAAGLIKS